LLPGITYFHVVFTLPAELRDFARSHQKKFLPILFAAAVEAIQELAADPEHLGGRVGILALLHTWSRTLSFHPHLHTVIPGLFQHEDGTFETCSSFLLPLGPLRKLFRGKFISKLKKVFDETEQLPFIDPAKEWNVHIKKSVSHTDRLFNYLARYVSGQAIDNSRILAVENDQVTFSYKRDRQRKTMTLPVFEFLRRYLQHTLPKGFHRIRTYGLLHPTHKETMRHLQLRLLQHSSKPALSAVPTRKPVFPCPNCGQAMTITATYVSFTSFQRTRPP
jgi:hypothetical protein